MRATTTSTRLAAGQEAPASDRIESYRGGIALARALLDLERGHDARRVLLMRVTRESPRPATTHAELVETEMLTYASSMWDDLEHDAARRLVSSTALRLDQAPGYPGLQDAATRWLEEHPLP